MFIKHSTLLATTILATSTNMNRILSTVTNIELLISPAMMRPHSSNDKNLMSEDKESSNESGAPGV